MKLQWKWDTCKKCTLYKYLPYIVQCRSYSKKPVNQLYIYYTVLGAAIKCKPYSEITVDIGTQLKTVKNYIEYICSVDPLMGTIVSFVNEKCCFSGSLVAPREI